MSENKKTRKQLEDALLTITNSHLDLTVTQTNGPVNGFEKIRKVFSHIDDHS